MEVFRKIPDNLNFRCPVFVPFSDPFQKKRNNLCFFLGVFSMNFQHVGISNFLKSSTKSRAEGQCPNKTSTKRPSLLGEKRAESPNFLIRTPKHLLLLILFNKKNTGTGFVDLSWGIVVICEQFSQKTPESSGNKNAPTSFGWIYLKIQPRTPTKIQETQLRCLDYVFF